MASCSSFQPPSLPILLGLCSPPTLSPFLLLSASLRLTFLPPPLHPFYPLAAPSSTAPLPLSRCPSLTYFIPYSSLFALSYPLAPSPSPLLRPPTFLVSSPCFVPLSCFPPAASPPALGLWLSHAVAMVSPKAAGGQGLTALRPREQSSDSSQDCGAAAPLKACPAPPCSVRLPRTFRRPRPRGLRPPIICSSPAAVGRTLEPR